VGKTSNDLNAFKTEMYKHLTELVTKVKTVDAINDKVNSHHLEFKNLKQVVKQVDDAFKKLVNERLENVLENHTTSFADIVQQQLGKEMVKNVGETVKKEMNESLGKVSNNIVQTTIHESKIQAAKQRDHESRRNNIIQYKVPEGDAPSNEERNKQDVAFCLQLFNMCMQVGIGEEELVHVFTLDKKTRIRSTETSNGTTI